MINSFCSSEPPNSFSESKTARAVSHSTAAHPCRIGQEKRLTAQAARQNAGKRRLPSMQRPCTANEPCSHPPFVDLISSLLYQTFPENPVPAENLSPKSRFISNSFSRRFLSILPLLTKAEKNRLTFRHFIEKRPLFLSFRTKITFYSYKMVEFSHVKDYNGTRS